MMLDELLTQHNGLEREIERRAVTEVRAWLLSHKVTEIRVDDQNEHPSSARDFEDEDLDQAIAWLPLTLLHNPTHPAWNPVIRMREIDEFLTTTTLEAEVGAPSTVWLEFNGARWRPVVGF